MSPPSDFVTAIKTIRPSREWNRSRFHRSYTQDLIIPTASRVRCRLEALPELSGVLGRERPRPRMNTRRRYIDPLGATEDEVSISATVSIDRLNRVCLLTADRASWLQGVGIHHTVLVEYRGFLIRF